MLLKCDNVDKWSVNGVCKNFVKNYFIFIQIYTNLSFHATKKNWAKKKSHAKIETYILYIMEY